MKKQIPEFLQKKLNQSNAVLKFFPEEINEFMIEYAKFYNWGLDDDILKIFRVMKQGITNLPICGVDNCKNKVNFNKYTKPTKGCCPSHSREITNLEKYGCASTSNIQSVKEKQKQTCLKKYGVTNVFQSEEIKDKIKRTNLEKYGVEFAI